MKALEQAKALTWGSYGPGALEAHRDHGTPLPPLVEKTLGELDTDHLEAIIEHVESLRLESSCEALVICIRFIIEDRAKVSTRDSEE